MTWIRLIATMNTCPFDARSVRGSCAGATGLEPAVYPRDSLTGTVGVLTFRRPTLDTASCGTRDTPASSCPDPRAVLFAEQPVPLHVPTSRARAGRGELSQQCSHLCGRDEVAFPLVKTRRLRERGCCLVPAAGDPKHVREIDERVPVVI